MQEGAVRAVRKARVGALSGSSRQLAILFAGLGLVVIGVVSLAGWMLADARRLVWEHAVQSSQSLAGAISHDILQSFTTGDLTLQAVIEGLQAPGFSALSPELRRHLLFDRAAVAGPLGAIAVLDANGSVVLDSRGADAPDGNVSDRRYFTVHRDWPDLGLFIDGPLRNAKGDWVIVLTRRFNGPDGRFGGIVRGTLRLGVFSRLFDAIGIRDGRVISLTRADGRLVVRWPYREQDIGRDIGRARIFRAFATAPSGEVEGSAVIDGTPRLYAYAQVGNLPFILAVATPREQILAEWRQKAVLIGGVVLVLAAIAALLGAALVSELRRRSAAERIAVESKRRLAEKSTILEATLETMDQGLLLVAADRTVPVHNRRAIELLGLPPRLMAGQPHFDEILAWQLQSGEFAGAQESFKEWVRSGGVATTRQIYERQRPNGTVLEIRTVPLEGGGGVRTYTDITRGKQAEAALAAAKREAEAAALEAERARVDAEAASRSKSDFLANMSHELRTPLNAIIGFSEMIRDAAIGPLHARYRGYACDIHTAGSHLLSLINDVLDLSKVEVGRLDIQDEAIDVATLLGACCRIVAARAANAGLEVVQEIAGDLPAVHADERRLKQIVLNLLSNAIKFTPGGGSVVVSARALASGEIAIAVSDTGIGMRPEDVSVALEPFRQIDSSLTRRFDGTGLGLPLVQRLVHLHGGRLAIETAPGAGTAVTVTLPASRCRREVA